MKRISLVLLLGVIAAPNAEAASDFTEANLSYENGDFDKAVTGYESLVARGVHNEELFYNLGNAYFRLDELGRAIYNYERALRLLPEMKDAEFNLRVARDVVAQRTRDRFREAEVDPLWVRLANHFTIGKLTLALLILNTLFFSALLLLRFLMPGFRRTVLFVTNSFVGVALLTCLAMFVLQVVFLERVRMGIVLKDQVVMREGTGADLAERGTLHAGLRVQVVEESAGWFRVRLSTGNEGWVPESSVGRL